MIRKILAIIGSAIFLVIAPGFVAGLVPRWISRWRLEAHFFGMPLFRSAGGILIALGVAGLLDSFARFAVEGVGTPAPVFPTRHLVVTGLYRYVRNPNVFNAWNTLPCHRYHFSDSRCFSKPGRNSYWSSSFPTVSGTPLAI
jgi:hypothetical protein